MQMIRHQNIFADKHATIQTGLAKLSEIFVDFEVGENRFAIFGASGDEVERVAGEKPVKTFESGRTLVWGHMQNVAAVCDRRKNFEWEVGGHRPPLQQSAELVEERMIYFKYFLAPKTKLLGLE